MGYTNKTSHYELPQYVANDKPSWLGDFNAAMLKIDTAMADNNATAEAANSAATGAQTQVSALSAQLSTIQGQVNTAVDTATTADGKATTAQAVAGEANTNAGEAKTLAQAAKQTADNALPISGGTMTGKLVLSGAPDADNQAATKAYVDAHSTDITYTENQTTKHSNVTVSTLGKLYVYGRYVEISMPSPATYNAVTQVGEGQLLMPFAQVAGNPCNLSANTYKKFGVAHRTRASQSAFPNMFLYYDGSTTYVCTRNAQVGDEVGALSGGLLIE